MTAEHVWNFFRAGGFDQVQLDNGADLLALKELNQKLWVALSCPTRGIEFDAKTLEMIDADADGQVRANEVLAAIAWAGSLLKDADLLVSGSDVLRLSDINDGAEEGKYVLLSARHVLSSLGKADAAEISLADMVDVEKLIASLQFNGDGVVCANQVRDAALRTTVEEIIRCVGSATDLSGAAGVNQALCEQFFGEAAAYADWQSAGEQDLDVLFLSDKTQAAADAFYALHDKMNDYFTRCHLAGYDPRAATPLSRSAEDYQRVAAQLLSAQSDEVASFPLATIEADKSLPLLAAINPAWRARVRALHDLVIVPLLGNRQSLSADEWLAVCAKFSRYSAWQAGKPAGDVAQLGMDRIREILAGSHQTDIADLIARDAAVAAEVSALRSVEKLLRYKRDLFTLVNNFVSFRNFYTGKDKAIFQAGTLYLDGRSCELVVKVEDIAKHAGFAAKSGVCLVYCDCVRQGGTETMSIAAAFTAGDSDYLSVGRNGVFYDRRGRDWDATIVRMIDQPISIRQAFWSPYKKLARMIGEQLQKIAASKKNAAEERMISGALDKGKAVLETPDKPEKQAFDIGKFAGIFAAIGLAVAAIGGILASIVGGLFSLKVWQMPLAILALMLLISAPAMLLAWLKLKKRNLAPILDANGWAVNARARINVPFGTSLTGLADFPEGARRSLVDPYADKKSRWPYYLVLLSGCLLFALWYAGLLA